MCRVDDIVGALFFMDSLGPAAADTVIVIIIIK